MAVSRGLLLLCLAALLFSMFMISVAEPAAETEEHSEQIDNVRPLESCSGEPNKGDQCREDEGDEFVDDDFDDTYKIVNKVAVTFSARTGTVEPAGPAAGLEAGLGAETSEPEMVEDQSHLIVLGH